MNTHALLRRCIAAALLAVLCAALPAMAVPRHSANAGAKFMFIAYGDTRSDAAEHAKIVAYIASLHPEFVLQTGDLVNHGNDAAQWAQFDNIVAPLRGAHIPYYPARGNHDLGPYYIKEVTQPYDSGTGYYYAFTRKGIRFIALDCFEPFDQGTQQYSWLTGQLKTAAGKTIIVFFHESPYSVGPHGSNMEVQQQLSPLFAKYHATIVFCGHDHLYYRTTRNKVVYIVTGGGGAPLYPASNTQFAIPGDVYKSVHHIVRCNVAPTTITLTALETDGTVIDTLVVPRPR